MGISISEYNEMTPYELSIHAQVFNEKRQTEKEEKITLVWLAERFHRMKTLPSLKEVLGHDRKSNKKKMTSEEMLNEVKKLNAAFGGTSY